jgi:hypothetical protein
MPFRSLLRRIVSRKYIRRFGCDPAQYELINQLFSRAFASTENTLYRLDVLEDDSPFDMQPDESIVFFHLKELNHKALEFDRGKQVVHLIATGVNYRDVNGHYPNESKGCVLHPSPEYWL